MREKLYSLWFLQKGSIRTRIFRLILLSSLIVVLIMSLLVGYGLVTMNFYIKTQSNQLSDASASYIEQVTSQQISERLTDVAQTRARAIETELWSITNDTNYLASGVENIIKNPQYYTERSLPDPRLQPIKSGEVYLHKGAKLQAAGLSPELQHEIRLMSNVKDYLGLMAQQYSQYESSLFVGSKYGYIIAADNSPGNEYINMTDEFLNTYEPTERGWYKNTQRRDAITFNDIYVGADGYPSFTCSAPFEDEQGFAGVVAVACSVKSISDIMADSLVGESAISFVLGDRGKIMLSTSHEGDISDVNSTDLRKMDNENLARVANKMLAGEKGWEIVDLDGYEYFLAYAPMDKLHWSFGTLIAKDEVMNPVTIARHSIVDRVKYFQTTLNGRVLKLVFVAILCILLALVILFNLSSWLTDNFVKPIKNLTSGVQEIADGNLEKKIFLSTGDELETLANSFNNMTDELQKYMEHITQVTMEKEHIATELAVATNIQESMLPHIFPFAPEHSEFDIYAVMHAAKEVGGDFYDFYLFDDEHLMITIADVSGKGVPAALFMVVAKTLLKNSTMAMEDVDHLSMVMERTNNQLCQNNDAMMFVTAFIGMLDLKTGRFSYVNAGHNPPLIYRKKENHFSYMQVDRNFVLGGMEDMGYKGQEMTLFPGDRLLLYTDGVTEALNEQKELFGEERLLDKLNSIDVEKNSTRDLLNCLKNELDGFVGEADQSDDITLLTLLYYGAATGR